MRVLPIAVLALLAGMMPAAVQASHNSPLYTAANQYRDAVVDFERQVLRSDMFDRHDERLTDDLEDATSVLRSAARNPGTRFDHAWHEVQLLHPRVEAAIFGRSCYRPSGHLVRCWQSVVRAYGDLIHEIEYLRDTQDHAYLQNRRVVTTRVVVPSISIPVPPPFARGEVCPLSRRTITPPSVLAPRQQLPNYPQTIYPQTIYPQTTIEQTIPQPQLNAPIESYIEPDSGVPLSSMPGNVSPSPIAPESTFPNEIYPRHLPGDPVPNESLPYNVVPNTDSNLVVPPPTVVPEQNIPDFTSPEFSVPQASSRGFRVEDDRDNDYRADGYRSEVQRTVVRTRHHVNTHNVALPAWGRGDLKSALIGALLSRRVR